VKKLLSWLALVVLAGTALAWWLGRPEKLDESLFVKTMAHERRAPLEAPRDMTELAGLVTTHDGRPAADAWVVLERPEPFERGPAPVRGEYTDANGAFRFAALAAGAYRVVLQHASCPPRTFTTEVPAAGEVRWALAEPLPPIEAMPSLVRGALAGRVSLPAGLAPRDFSGYEVVLAPVAETHPLSGAAVRRARCAADGSFALPDLVQADYDARVLPPWASGGSWPELAHARCAHRSAETELALELRVGSLAGRLVEPPDRPLVGAVVRITSLTAKDVLGKPQLWPPIVTDGTGHFKTDPLPTGRYLLHARAGDGIQDLEVEVQGGVHHEVEFAPLAPRASPR
jgi:hypothetical protein